MLIVNIFCDQDKHKFHIDRRTKAWCNSHANRGRKWIYIDQICLYQPFQKVFLTQHHPVVFHQTLCYDESYGSI